MDVIAKITIRLSAMAARTDPSGSPSACLGSVRPATANVTATRASVANRAMTPMTTRTGSLIASSALTPSICLSMKKSRMKAMKQSTPTAMLNLSRPMLFMRASVGPAQAAVDVDALAADVAGLGRAQEGDQVRHVAGIAEVAERDVAGELLLVFSRGVQSLIDLLAVDAPGRQAVHGDAVTADVARQPLRPRVHRGLGRPRRVGPRRLGGARDVEDAPPAPLDHAGQERLGEPAHRGEVDGQRFVPHGIVRVEERRPRAAGVVDEDVGVAQSRQGLVAHARR